MKTLVNYINESLVFEGGKAVDGTPMTQPIARKIFAELERDFLPKLGLVNRGIDYATLGSFNKKKDDQTSGDIDIAVSVEAIASHFGVSVDAVEEAIVAACEKENLRYKHSKGIHLVSLAWPIPGMEDHYGQVDLMPSDNMEFSTWIYHSPDFTKAESKYKGLYRNELMRVICRKADRKILSRNEQDEVMEYERRALDYSEGITQAIKSHVGKKGRTKHAKTLKETKKFITKTPQDIIDFIFGEGHKASEVMTFEAAYKIFMSEDFPWAKDRLEMVEDYIEELEKRNAPIPSELYDDWKDKTDKLNMNPVENN